MPSYFENALVNYCAPTLAGLKPASLMACEKAEYPNLGALAAQYTAALRAQGLRFEVVCRCAHSSLLLVYREDMLRRRLAEPAAAALLQAAGYPAGGALAEMLARLKRRIAQNADFPHEIGVFLGYPLEDVRGFQRHKGQNFKLCGYWKVYSDVERAKRCFAQYDHCRACFAGKLAQGMSITQLLRAA
ncbi:DUF3793 family protein [Intestinibacillus massiliensis]|uniref:DUF3793 family protein n=1 Tax=Intestinibacillus massiliensis TaxID=1871029 RepID=UPI000B359519|nr:DUF3793 family protein [Intestinibacillus massiliensis]